MAKKKHCTVDTLLSKINGMDNKICNLTEKIKLLKQLLDEQQDENAEEVCPDVIESEKAVVEAIEKLYVEELMTREPEGDA